MALPPTPASRNLRPPQVPVHAPRAPRAGAAWRVATARQNPPARRCSASGSAARRGRACSRSAVPTPMRAGQAVSGRGCERSRKEPGGFSKPQGGERRSSKDWQTRFRERLVEIGDLLAAPSYRAAHHPRRGAGAYGTTAPRTIRSDTPSTRNVAALSRRPGQRVPSRLHQAPADSEPPAAPRRAAVA